MTDSPRPALGRDGGRTGIVLTMRRGDHSALPVGTVTFLFTDMEGSTRLLQQLGDRFGGVAARHIELLSDSLTSHGGTVFGTEGDAVFAAFTDAGAAVRAAADGQRRLASEAWPDGVAVRVRMGVHTGEATVVEGDYACLAIVVAARIAAAGHGGQVLLSTATRDAAELGDDDVVDLGSHQLKDLPAKERLWQLVIADEPALPSAFPPPRSLTGVAHNLPGRLTPFVGRDREIDELEALVREMPLVTILGPGGAGKTRVAIEVARRLVDQSPGGVWFADLSAIPDGDLVGQAVATAMDLRTAGVDPVDAVAQSLGAASAVIVLDNCERVAASAGAFAAALAGRCPRLRVLATSQLPLAGAGERRWTIAPLAFPSDTWSGTVDDLVEFDAVRLFVQRAKDRRSDFAVDAANAPHVAALCRRLEGSPLAIELAAARTEMLTPAQIERRLDEQLELAAEGAPARQTTLRAALEWSYRLLTGAERALLDRLSVFAGGCTVDAAEEVCAGDSVPRGDVFGLLSNLVQRAFVATDAGGDEVRFRLLDPVRQFARGQLSDAASDELARRHLAHYSEVAARTVPDLRGGDLASALRDLDADHDNLRGALDAAVVLGEAEVGGRLAGELVAYWEIRGHIKEAIRWLRLVRDLPGLTDETTAQTAVGLGLLSRIVADYATAESCYREAADLHAATGDIARRATAQGHLAMLRRDQGDLDQAKSLLEEQVQLLDAVGTEWERAAARLNLANVLIMREEGEAAWPLLETALAAFDQLDDARGVASATSGLGRIAQQRGDLVGCLHLQERALAAVRQLGDRQKIGQLLFNVATAARSVGDHAAARAHYEEAVPLLTELGMVRIAATARAALASMAVDERRFDDAERECAHAIDLARRAGESYALGFALMNMADILVWQDRAGEAWPVLAEAVEHLTAVWEVSYLRACVGTAAWIEYKVGNAVIASRLFGAVEQFERANDSAVAGANAVVRATALDDLRARVGDDTFDREFAAGAVMSLEDAVAIVRDRVAAQVPAASPS